MNCKRVILKAVFSVITISSSMLRTGMAQDEFHAEGVKTYNYGTFNTAVSDTPKELFSLTPDSLYTHPEFGILPYNAPCEDCIELLQYRTQNSRMFVKKGTNGSKFYSQGAYQDLNYKDNKGNWVTIDPTLQPSTALPGVYLGLHQTNPTTLNMVEGYTAIAMQDGAELRFNQNISAYATSEIGLNIPGIAINRSVYSVGADGAAVKDAFPGIDQELRFNVAEIKSGYTVWNLNAIDTSKKYFVIRDEFDLPEGYTISTDQYEGTFNVNGFWFGDLVIENADGFEMARMKAPVMYDSNPNDTLDFVIPMDIIGYTVKQNGRTVTLKLVTDMAYLRDPQRQFPITIDPTVYGTTTTWTGTSGTDDSPTFCNVVVNVPTPANATLTGSSVHWEFDADGVACSPFCKLKFLQLRIGTSCGYSPSAAGVWVCPACNTAGTWNPTVDDATTAALVSCFTPQCASFNIAFTIYHNQYQCVTPGGCVTTCAHLDLATITVEGETVTTTGLAAGATAYTVLDCTLQSGWLSTTTPNYGVPPYTYTWSPGGYTTSPVYVTFPMGTTTYTVTMTDACGNVATDNVTVINNCVTLPIELISFSGYSLQDVNILEWEASSSLENKTFFVERSSNGRDYVSIGMVEAANPWQTKYSFSDDQIASNVYYYRLRQVDEEGSTDYSNIISIQSSGNTDALVINEYDANTGNLALTLFSPYTGSLTLHVFDITGRLIADYPFQTQAGATSIQLQLPSIAAGTYLLSIQETGVNASARLVR